MYGAQPDLGAPSGRGPAARHRVRDPPVIATWQKTPSASAVPELTPVAQNPSSLRNHLANPNFDPSGVGKLLATLDSRVRTCGTTCPNSLPGERSSIPYTSQASVTSRLSAKIRAPIVLLDHRKIAQKYEASGVPVQDNVFITGRRGLLPPSYPRRPSSPGPRRRPAVTPARERLMKHALGPGWSRTPARARYSGGPKAPHSRSEGRNPDKAPPNS